MKNKSIKYIFMPFLLAVAFLTAASFSATPGYESDTIDTETSQTANVSIKLFTFNPKVLEVTAGTTVVWTNGDAIEHSVTNGTPERPRSDFDSGFFTKGQTYSFKFTEAGEYEYFCKRHNSMQGIIRVAE